MEFRLRSAALVIAVFFGAITSLTGCATTGMDRATKTTDSMHTVEGDYKQAAIQIDATRMALENLTNPAQTNMKKAYEVYDDNVKKMEKSGSQLDMHTDKMNVNGARYFAEWESSYTNPDIREISEQRRIEMRKGYAKIAEASVGVKGALKSYMTDIREIQKYISNDLTAQGIETIKPIAQTAVADGERLKEAVKPVLQAIDQVKSEMVQGGSSSESATDNTKK
ncbi:MAG: DUF2959 family protein [Desulfuromonadaceae bacterium]|nr:DUF2959 family protein [Desulfuromonadaceae bacterium]